MKNKHSSEGGSQKGEPNRAKRKSSTEIVAPVEYFFSRRKEKDLRNMSKKTETVSQIRCSKRIPHRFSES